MVVGPPAYAAGSRPRPARTGITRVNSSHGAPGFGELLSKLDFELCDLVRCMGHPGQHATRQQTHSELVRVMKNDRVVDCQVK